MTYIVERLRRDLMGISYDDIEATVREAADEIERLRALATVVREQGIDLTDLRADSERLRAALQAMINHFKMYEDAECCKRCFAEARAALEPKP